MAAKVGNVGLMEQLVATKKVDINAADNVGRTALMHAATSKNVAAVKSLHGCGRQSNRFAIRSAEPP
jgi:ankyrin repeat protein